MSAVTGSVALAALVGLLLTRTSRSSALRNVARPASSLVALATKGPSLASLAPTVVTLRFEAEPARAHLFDEKGTDLGETPVKVQVPRGDTAKDYAFRLVGYHDVSLSATADEDRTLSVSLQRLKPPTASSGASERPGSTRRRMKRSEAPIDEDGLATPSF